MAAPFEFSEIQAEHILDMTLSRLTRLGRSDLESEMAKLRETIADLRAILADDGRLRAVIKDEMGAIRAEFATPRRAEITYDDGDMNVEDLIDDEELVITMSRAGYIKAMQAATFRTQGRGGRGVQGANLKEEDLVSRVTHTTAHAYLLFFSNLGRVYRLRAYEVPDQGAHGPGHGGGQPAAAGRGRAHPGAHRHAGTFPPIGTCSSPPSRDRSRRPTSPSTTSPAGRASSPSTCARATSSSASCRPATMTTSSWCRARG